MQKMFLVMNFRTALIVTLAVISTWICTRYNLAANFSSTFLVIAVVFPLAFSINSAYERREKALKEYAALKGNGRGLYFLLRDPMKQPQAASLSALRAKLEVLMDSLEQLLTDDQRAITTNQIPVYLSFSDLSRFVRSDMRQQNMTDTEMWMASSYLSEMMLAFESIKHIHQYRTPVTLKLFAEFFVGLVPIAYGPYFAYVVQDSTGGLLYVMPVMFSIVLCALVNIQDQLENPFDGYGEDDVIFHTRRYIESLNDDQG